MDAGKLHPQLRTTFRFLPTAPVATRLGRAVIRRATRSLPAGSPAQDYARMASPCTSLRIAVVMATYRLSPEHPFPTPLDDCEAARNWLVDHAGERGIDPSRIAIGGESAGGRPQAGRRAAPTMEQPVEPCRLEVLPRHGTRFSDRTRGFRAVPPG